MTTKPKRAPGIRRLSRGAPAAGEDRVSIRGENLRAERARVGLSCRALANLLARPPFSIGVSGKSILAWEQGRSRPLRSCAEAMAKILGVPLRRFEA